MKQFQIPVSVPLDEALKRIWSVMDQSSLPASFEVGWGKDFIGQINAPHFSLRVRQRSWRNSFAPSCSGQVHQSGSGSVIVFAISESGGIFRIFIIVFGLIFLFFFGLMAVVNIAIFLAGPADGSLTGLVVMVFSIGVPMVVLTVVLTSIYLINKAKSKSDENRLIELLHSLFRDVTIQQNRTNFS